MIGNVIQPNGESSGGGGGFPTIGEMTPVTFNQNDRFTSVAGGYKIIGTVCYVDLVLKLITNLPLGDNWEGSDWCWNCRTNLPTPYQRMVAFLDAICFKKDANNNYDPAIRAEAQVKGYNSGVLYVAANKNLDGANENIYFWIRGSYDIY